MDYTHFEDIRKVLIFWVGFKLSEEDYQELSRIHKRRHLNPRSYRKLMALIMLHQGHSVSVIEAAPVA